MDTRERWQAEEEHDEHIRLFNQAEELLNDYRQQACKDTGNLVDYVQSFYHDLPYGAAGTLSDQFQQNFEEYTTGASDNKPNNSTNNARKNNETTHKNSTNNVSNPPCWRRCCPLFVLGFEVDWFLFYPIQLLLKRPIRRPIKSVSNHLKPLYAYSRKPEESALLQQKTPFRKEWRFHNGGAAGN